MPEVPGGQFLNALGQTDGDPVIDAASKAIPLRSKQPSFGIGEDKPQHRLIMGETLGVDVAIPEREARREFREPADIVRAFMNRKHFAAHLHLVAVTGAGLLKLALQAGPFVVTD